MTFGEAARRLSGVAAGRLAWRPADFWTATPAELLACLGGSDEAEPPARDVMTRLMQQHPDRER